MTTDRTAAPSRSSALNLRASVAPATGRPQQDAPSDAFSSLLGAASPRREDAPRNEPPRGRRDDGPRQDRQRPNHDPKPARAGEPKAAEAPEAPKAPEAATPTEEPTETDAPTRVVTSDIFALQLAGPLPTTPQATPATGTAVLGEAEAQTPALPAFAPTNLSLAAGVPQATVPAATGEVTAEPVTAEAATATATATPATPGGIPLPSLAGMTPASAADLEGIELPATPPQTVATEAPATPQAETAATALPNANAEQAPSDGQPQPQQQQTPTAAAAAAAQQAKPADAPAPVTTQPVVQTGPVVPLMPTQPTSAMERAVPLYRAPETTALMIQIAAERGVSHARLNLKPAELGGIEVRLRTSPQGVSAHLVADSPEAAKLLVQAADDLRRDLADRDVNLLSLDVSTQSEQRDQQAAGTFQSDLFGDDYRPGQSRSIRFGSNGDAGLAEATTAADTTLVLPNGVLVDVLA